MPPGLSIRGTERVVNNLKKEIDKIEGRTYAGLLAAGLIIKRQAVKNAPIDTGNLRSSGYVEGRRDDKNGSSVTIGFSAAYALILHEAIKGRGKIKPRAGRKRRTKRNESAGTSSKRTSKSSVTNAARGGQETSGITIKGGRRIMNFRVGGPKFLKRAVQSEEKKALDAIRRRAQIR